MVRERSLEQDVGKEEPPSIRLGVLKASEAAQGEVHSRHLSIAVVPSLRGLLEMSERGGGWRLEVSDGRQD